MVKNFKAPELPSLQDQLDTIGKKQPVAEVIEKETETVTTPPVTDGTKSEMTDDPEVKIEKTDKIGTDKPDAITNFLGDLIGSKANTAQKEANTKVEESYTSVGKETQEQPLTFEAQELLQEDTVEENLTGMQPMARKNGIATVQLAAPPPMALEGERTRYQKVNDFVKSSKGRLMLSQIAMATTQQGSPEHELAAGMYKQFQSEVSNQDKAADPTKMTPSERTEAKKVELDERRVDISEKTAEAQIEHFGALGDQISSNIDLNESERDFTFKKMEKEQQDRLIQMDEKLANDLKILVDSKKIDYAQAESMRKSAYTDQIKRDHLNYLYKEKLQNAKSDQERTQIQTEAFGEHQKLYNSTSNNVWDQLKAVHSTAFTADSYMLEDRRQIVREYADSMDKYLVSAMQNGGMSLGQAQSLKAQNTQKVLNQAYPETEEYPDVQILPSKTGTGRTMIIRTDVNNKKETIILDRDLNAVQE